MIRKALYLLAMMAVTGTSWAQAPSPSGPRDHDIYCAGGFTNTPPPSDTYVITGQESDVRIVFRQGDLVYINRGSKQGVQAGNEFLVSRPVKDRSTAQWFVWQKDLMRSMGQAYADVGRLRVVHVDDNTTAFSGPLYFKAFVDKSGPDQVLYSLSQSPVPRAYSAKLPLPAHKFLDLLRLNRPHDSCPLVAQRNLFGRVISGSRTNREVEPVYPAV